jgi:hypothetical protein
MPSGRGGLPTAPQSTWQKSLSPIGHNKSSNYFAPDQNPRWRVLTASGLLHPLLHQYSERITLTPLVGED